MVFLTILSALRLQQTISMLEHKFSTFFTKLNLRHWCETNMSYCVVSTIGILSYDLQYMYGGYSVLIVVISCILG